MPSTDREVFEYFQSKPETPVEVDYLAYAKYAYDKYEWMQKFEEINKREPNVEEENNWIAHLPDSKLDETHNDAFGFFELAARKYMEDEIEEEKKSAINSSILMEIRNFTSFWRNLPANLMIGIFASLIFSVLIILMGVLFARDPSPVALYKELTPSPKADHESQIPTKP